MRWGTAGLPRRSLAASWPHAASMSPPRLGLKVAESPRSRACWRNSFARVFEVAEKPVSVQLKRRRFRW